MPLWLLYVPLGPESQRRSTSCSGSFTGSDRSTKSWTRLNKAVFAPMPRASERIATVVKPGDLASWRRARRMKEVRTDRELETEEAVSFKTYRFLIRARVPRTFVTTFP